MLTNESLLDGVHMCFFMHMFVCVFCILISLSCQEVEPAQREAYCGKMCRQFLFSTSLLKGTFVSHRERAHLETLFFWVTEVTVTVGNNDNEDGS